MSLLYLKSESLFYKISFNHFKYLKSNFSLYVINTKYLHYFLNLNNLHFYVTHANFLNSETIFDGIETFFHIKYS